MHVTPLSPDDADVVRVIADASAIAVDLDAERSHEWSRIWVARASADAPVVAFLVAWDVADELQIQSVATHPDARRGGAAKALVAEALAHAARRRVRFCTLEVRFSNRAAIRLYRSFGFRAIGVRRGYYRDTSEDALQMTLTFDPTTGAIRPGRDEIPYAEA